MRKGPLISGHLGFSSFPPEVLRMLGGLGLLRAALDLIEAIFAVITAVITVAKVAARPRFTAALALAFLAAFASSCFKLGGIGVSAGEGAGTKDLNDRSGSPGFASGASTIVPTSQASGGVTTGQVSSGSSGTQVVQTPTGGALSGSSVSFPPGSLAVSTTITVEPAVSLTTPVTTAQLGISGTVTSAGTPIVVSSSSQANAITPFTIALALPPEASLLGDGSANLEVIYSVVDRTSGTSYVGLIDSSGVSVSGGFAVFQTTLFGAYQAVYTTNAVSAPVKVATTSQALSVAAAAALPAVSLTGRAPFIVNSGGTITLSGSHFRQSMTLAMGGKPVGKVSVLSDVSASFVAPGGLAKGLVSLDLEEDGVSQSATLVYTGGAGQIPFSSMSPAQVCSGEQFYDASGTLQTGTKNCGGPDLSALTPASLLAGVTVAGVTGTLTPSPAACASDGQTGCAIGSGGTYAAALTTGLAAKVLSGQSVAGVAGNVTVPSSASVLSGVSYGSGNSLSGALTLPPGSSVLSGLTYGSPAALVSGSLTLPSAASVWASSGNYGVGGNSITPTLPSCSSDGETSCVTSGMFKAGNVSGISAWDLRVGQSLAGVSGALKTSCRNGTNTAIFNYDGAVTSLPNTAVSSGTALDYWDTLDDYDGTNGTVTAWTSANSCGSSTFLDTTTLNGNSSLTTCGSSSTCILKDQITNLRVTGVLSSGGNTTTSTSATFVWNAAVAACAASTYGGYSAGSWRLPTQKELMSLYEHGLVAAASTNFGPTASMEQFFWSASTEAVNTGDAWGMNPSNGLVDTFSKAGAYYVICVM